MSPPRLITHHSSLVTLNSALDWLDSLQGSGIRPGLGRMRALLRTLGRPERAYPSIIVAGRNGEGATSAALPSNLNVSRDRTRLCTPPRLGRLRGRWCSGDRTIQPAPPQ